MTWVTKFAVLGLAAVGGTIALWCIPVETRHRVTRAAGDWVNKKMLDYMGRVLASLPEAAPPRLVMSILPKLEAQNERILALLREQNALLRRQHRTSNTIADA